MLALAAYPSVLMFSSINLSLGERQAIISVYELPPKLCLRSYVSLLSRYGTNLGLSPFYSVRAVITLRRTNKLLLISILSLAWRPVVPVRLCFSEPARSTSWSRLTVILACDLTSWASTVNEKMLWLLLENSFRLCDARILFADPNLNSLSASAAVWHSKT